jgi:hypothetical protein
MTHRPGAHWTNEELLEILRWMDERRSNTVKKKAAELGIADKTLQSLMRRVAYERDKLKAQALTAQPNAYTIGNLHRPGEWRS